MASHTQDDGFHEIQLNGKQLVFLFMAATAVSVVFFLCGVWVGRGVRAERGAAAETAALSAAAEPAPQSPPPAVTAPPAGSDPRVAAPPPPAADDLSYFNRLEKTNPGSEELKATPEKAAVAISKPAAPDNKPVAAPEKTPAAKAAVALEKPVPVAAKASPASDKPASVAAAAAPKVVTPPPAAPAAPPAAAPIDAAPAGSGYAVQIAALNVRTEADAIAKRLTSKGYAAYVLSSASGTPKVFRVRVGKFPTRREAESVAAKLQKEEQFKPWVTR